MQAQIGVKWIGLVDDPLQMNMVTPYICAYKSITGYADVILGGGIWADNNGNPPKVFSYDDGTQSGIISTNMYLTRSYSTPSTNWVYLSNNGTTTNLDYIQIVVVSANYTGDCSQLQAANPPDGWTTGFPPAPVPNGL